MKIVDNGVNTARQFILITIVDADVNTYSPALSLIKTESG